MASWAYAPLQKIDSGKAVAMVTYQNENKKCQVLWNEVTMRIALGRLKRENDNLRV